MYKKITTLILAFTLLLGCLLWPVAVSAAGASISLTASRSTVPNGGTIIIGVYMNGGGAAVNAVQVDLAYPAGKLQYVGYSSNGSAFEIGASSGGGGGTATIARGSVSPVSGSGLVGTVTFKALVGSGSTAISVAGSSSLVSDGNPVPYSAGGVNVNFGAVAASGGAAKAAAPAPPKDTTAPVITDVKLKDVTPFSVIITWATSEPSNSTVDYGLDANYGLSASASPSVTAHSVILNSAFLTPLSLIHYRVRSADSAGNVATGTDKAVQLPGVPVTIVVRGAGGKPQAGATVTLDGATGITDSKGSVTLRSGLGNKKIVTTHDGVTVQKPITVAKAVKPLPPYQLDLAKKPMNVWILTSVGLAILVLTLLAIDAVLFGSRLLARVAGVHLIPHGFHRNLGHAATASAQFAATPAPPPDMPEKEAATVAADDILSPPEKPIEQAVDDMLAVPSTEPEPKPAPILAQEPINDVQPSKPIKIELNPLSVAESLSPPTENIASRLKKPKAAKAKTNKTKTAPKIPDSR